ncbi:cellobiose phosphorylase [Chloroflexota bacterium]|nr:cellobiose phosphorylase [Chloroflexota bacterium]
MIKGWHYIDHEGTFVLENPQHMSYLYFPLLNEKGLVSSISPLLNGDIKTSQNSFLTVPVSIEDLHNNRSARNFWLKINDQDIWSVTGNSAKQMANRLTVDEDEVSLTAGILWHRITRSNTGLGLRAEITNFVAKEDNVELMKVRLINIGKNSLSLKPTAAIPIFGRSADNLRDHRHVTSLLQRVKCVENGVVVQPTMTFDERGHKPNSISYGVLGVEGDGMSPIGFYPDIESFIGEGGALDWPSAIVGTNHKPVPAGTTVSGYEALGGIQFRPIQLQPKEEISYILLMFIEAEQIDTQRLTDKYGSIEKFDEALKRNNENWHARISTLSFSTNDSQFDNWLRWVTLQPILRQQMGNSFLPYHDYGRGGRGWRDLWQDVNASLLMGQKQLAETLWGYFAGVRMDGSNATIIGTYSGEFTADRNNISRVWMDHGSWPLSTVNFYINQTGNLEFLLREQLYFKDSLSHRAKQKDNQWSEDLGNVVRSRDGEIYHGSILEHILIQHLTAFYHVGDHNCILLEDADWNDALDMANQKGESVAFSAYYAGNLKILGDLCEALSQKGFKSVELAEELTRLVEPFMDPVDYESPIQKREKLQSYFDQVGHNVSGKKVKMATLDLSQDLNKKAEWLINHLRNNEWINNADGTGWFNSYYNNSGIRLDGVHGGQVRMMLTGQVFMIMCGIATNEQMKKIVQSADKYLFDESIGGYRLNTDFLDNIEEFGRVSGFAFGHKENGSMFSHMAMMYAYGLYKRGLAEEGWKVLKNVYDYCNDFSKSKIYPGVPEYINPRGRGMYPYLTGSASWLLLTLLTESYGVRGVLGDLLIEPKLMAEQFNQAGIVSVQTSFAGKALKITYINPKRLSYGQYTLDRVDVNGETFCDNCEENAFHFKRDYLDNLSDHSNITIYLTEKH